jgi:Transposase DDE domain group 1
MRGFGACAAYWLIGILHDAIPKPQPLASGEFSTIRLRLLMIATPLKETASRIGSAFAAGCPDAEPFRDLVGALSLRSRDREGWVPRRNLS